ncbi:LlaJI family restriction endonuclease [Carnobacteriaceae bacterium zg-ZUI252]|nr:LlaJI family restriction endonuclease [Carnobacteriaceae bacterium zg-ZUI252]
MKSVFIREQGRYTFDELMNLFNQEEKSTIKKISRLKRYGVLKTVRQSKEQSELSELQEENIEIFDEESRNDEYFYVFTFVGVIVLEGTVLIIYPKYIHDNSEPIDEIKQIIKVLEKYHAKEQIVKMYNDAYGESSFNLLALILYLIRDFYDNGLYTSEQEIYEFNGRGEINWDKTINETFAFLSNSRPLYPELITKRKILDDMDYFKRLHEVVLTSCYNKLKENKLDKIFGIEEIELSEFTLDDFGNIDYILDKITKELNIQFNTRKQLLLKGLYSFVAKNGLEGEVEAISLFGTNSFNLVWEKACAEVLNNQLKTRLNQIKLINKIDGFDYTKRLIDIIEKPKWFEDDNSDLYLESKDTLKPDIVTIESNIDENSSIFYIFDAKYYDLDFSQNGKILRGYPGIDSIDKQYLYQLAYNEFIEKHTIGTIINCFLFPTEQNIVINTGFVRLDFMKNLNLEDIKLRLIPAKKVFDLYLKNGVFPIEELNF